MISHFTSFNFYSQSFLNKGSFKINQAICLFYYILELNLLCLLTILVAVESFSLSILLRVGSWFPYSFCISSVLYTISFSSAFNSSLIQNHSFTQLFSRNHLWIPYHLYLILKSIYFLHQNIQSQVLLHYSYFVFFFLSLPVCEPSLLNLWAIFSQKHSDSLLINWEHPTFLTKYKRSFSKTNFLSITVIIALDQYYVLILWTLSNFPRSLSSLRLSLKMSSFTCNSQDLILS